MEKLPHRPALNVREPRLRELVVRITSASALPKEPDHRLTGTAFRTNPPSDLTASVKPYLISCEIPHNYRPRQSAVIRSDPREITDYAVADRGRARHGAERATQSDVRNPSGGDPADDGDERGSDCG